MAKYWLEKVQSFEEFIDRQLKPDLIQAIGQRDKVFEQQNIYSDLKRNIENLEKNDVTSLHTMVILGSEVYMQADVYTFTFFVDVYRPDTRHIFVDVGLGFHVEFTWSEALKFISEKEKRIEMLAKVLGRYSSSKQSDMTQFGSTLCHPTKRVSEDRQHDVLVF